MNESINKAGGYGQYKFSQRQLYYAIRPYVIKALDKQPDYNYFCKLCLTLNWLSTISPVD